MAIGMHLEINRRFGGHGGVSTEWELSTQSTETARRLADIPAEWTAGPVREVAAGWAVDLREGLREEDVFGLFRGLLDIGQSWNPMALVLADQERP